MQYNCELIQQDEQPVLSVRTRTSVQDLPQAIGKAYEKIMAHMGELGEAPVGPPFVAYYNMDMQDLDIEVGFPVAVELTSKGDVQAAKIPARTAAACMHFGPYSAIEPAYNALGEWIKQSGYEATGISYEYYLNDPSSTPPEQLQTRIIFPLKNGG